VRSQRATSSGVVKVMGANGSSAGRCSGETVGAEQTGVVIVCGLFIRTRAGQGE